MSDDPSNAGSFGGEDPEFNRRTYDAVMRFSVRYGVPVAMGLAAFFSFLAMRAGVPLSALVGLATFAFVSYVGRTFFTH